MLATRLSVRRRHLVAAISLLLSPYVVADVAGRVNFVTGDVSVIDTNNNKRPLSKGDLVNSGERLETNDKGHVQIRFTDGSLLVLQPNSSFRLDSYNYDANKPADGSLIFNFLRGSMRTISGLIGKANHANYKIQTSVATLGIRGTDYAGVFDNGQLLLHVNKGLVNMTNDLGSADVPAGQTFAAQATVAPQVYTGAFPSEADPIEPDVEARADATTANPVEATATAATTATTETVANAATETAGITTALATTTGIGMSLSAAAAIIAADDKSNQPEKPRLENYENYNQFLQAMYAYKKAEAERNRTTPPQALSPEIEALSKQAISAPEMDNNELANTAPALITEGGESVDEAVERAKKLKLPRATSYNEYHRSTFSSFPLKAIDSPTMEESSIAGSFLLGFNAPSPITPTPYALENQTFKTAGKDNTLQNGDIQIKIENRDYASFLFGNSIEIKDVSQATITPHWRP